MSFAVGCWLIAGCCLLFGVCCVSVVCRSLLLLFVACWFQCVVGWVVIAVWCMLIVVC